jgi:hypothetical protein
MNRAMQGVPRSILPAMPAMNWFIREPNYRTTSQEVGQMNPILIALAAALAMLAATGHAPADVIMPTGIG